MRHDPARVRGARYEELPAHHRALWEAATAPRQGFADRRPAPRLRQPTLDKILEGWRRYIGFLRWSGGMDEDAPPHALLTPAGVDAFIDDLLALGRARATIIGYVIGAARAVALMCPGTDISPITHPGGRPLAMQFPRTPRIHAGPPAESLRRWGIEMMEAARAMTAPTRRAVQMRDGAMLALIAVAPIRLRALAGLRLGLHLVRHGSDWLLRVTPDLHKRGREEVHLLPASLTPWIDRYLARERVELMRGAQHDSLWANWGGAPLGYRGVDRRIRWWSQKRFGRACGAHAFRRALATALATHAPRHIRLVQPLLGHASPRTAHRHYITADQPATARRLATEGRRQRRDLETLGLRLLAEQDAVDQHQD